MSGETLKVFITMVVYMLVVIGIGLWFAKRANENSDNFFLGGRSIGPWVSALSAASSDMSGWLLMGLPGVAYFYGLSDAAWTAIGLAAGTIINWAVVARRLRRYSEVAGDAITLPEFFSNRFHDKKKILLSLTAIWIIVFFVVYAASCFVTTGRLFSTLFGYSYTSMMIVGAIFVLFYVTVGGFLAETASDTMQATVMVVALAAVLILGTSGAGGFSAVINNAKSIPGFFDFFGIASPTMVDGAQQVQNGVPVFGEAGKYGLYTVLSTMAWGLGYFGMPHVLLRFMAIRSEEEVKVSTRIAAVWVVISLFAAVMIGLIGRALFPATLKSAAAAETIFITMAQALFHPVFAGLVMAGILAATISSADSYLLIGSSAVAKNIYQGIFKKDATDKQVMTITRIILISITVIGIIIASNENSVIFTIVSFAWAGLGATFGPTMLFSLFWKRTTLQGAIAGMVSGAVTVFIWKLILKPMGGIFGVYELLPAFIISCLVIYFVSLATPEPSKEIQEEFELVKSGKPIVNK